MSAILDQSKSLPLGSAQVDIQLRVSAQVNITPFVARQKINVLMLDQVGNLLHGGEPELLIAEKLYWRVPVLLSTPRRGLVGQVGLIQVDAQTGEVHADDQLLKDIADHARQLLSTRFVSEDAEDTEIVRETLAALNAADGDRAKAGFRPWTEVRAELLADNDAEK